MKLGQKLAINYIRARINFLAVFSKEKAAEKAFRIFCTPFRKQKKKKPSIFNEAEPLSFDQNGYIINGHRWNNAAPEKVLIIHGFESTSFNFDRYVVPLIRKGYGVLAFDAPAHGISGGREITLPLYVDALEQIIKRFGPIQSFMAHSFGGLALALTLENMSSNHEKKAVFIAPATETTTAIDSFFSFLQLNKDIRESFDNLIIKKGGRPASDYSIRRAMHHIKSSVLWIHDEDDEQTPLSDAMKVKEDNHPNVEFLITKGLGHRKIYRENKVVKKIIEFL